MSIRFFTVLFGIPCNILSKEQGPDRVGVVYSYGIVCGGGGG